MRRQLLNTLAAALTLFGTIAAPASGAATPLDYLIVNGLTFDGTGADGKIQHIGVKGDRIVFIGANVGALTAIQTIDASGLIVSPGFIDVHTHAYNERPKSGPILLNSYITQGVTTVVSGNDGQGPVDIRGAYSALSERGLNANLALFVGHGSLRRTVMGMADRHPTPAELTKIKALIAAAMQDGALGLSTGLFYAPGSFAQTSEIIEIAKVAARYGGVYESHIRDESNYNIGLLAAIEEALQVGEQANIPVHIAHIKALGVDVWGHSGAVIERIEAARARGLHVTADQYPWLASGTRISNALVPRWAMGGGRDKMRQRLLDPTIASTIKTEMAENLRRRGGPGSLLLTGGKAKWKGLTLAEYSSQQEQTPIEMAIHIILNGDASVASFNMSPMDLAAFMQQPWVMSSSDGGSGHPRKFASFPHKYQRYVVEEKLLSLPELIRKSTSLPAQTLSLKGRGILEVGAYADILIFDPVEFSPKATFEVPDRISSGVMHLLVNGQLAIEDQSVTKSLSGKMLKPEKQPNT